MPHTCLSGFATNSENIVVPKGPKTHIKITVITEELLSVTLNFLVKTRTKT